MKKYRIAYVLKGVITIEANSEEHAEELFDNGLPNNLLVDGIDKQSIEELDEVTA